MTQAETSIADSVDELRRSLEGDVVVPGDVQYDAARLCFNAFVDRRPTAIVSCHAEPTCRRTTLSAMPT